MLLTKQFTKYQRIKDILAITLIKCCQIKKSFAFLFAKRYRNGTIVYHQTKALWFFVTFQYQVTLTVNSVINCIRLSTCSKTANTNTFSFNGQCLQRFPYLDGSYIHVRDAIVPR